MILTLDNLGAYGVARDAVVTALPDNGWSASNNVRYQDGYAQNFKGHGAVYGTPTVTPYWCMAYSSASARYWLYNSLTKAYQVTSNGTHTNITRSVGGDYTATADAKWSGCVLGGIAIMSNPNDTPQYWAGTSTAENLTNWTAGMTCQSLRSFKNHLIAMNITKSGPVNYPHMVKWSHPADPGSLPSSWDHTDTTKDAGELDLDDDPTRVVDGMALGQQFIVYKEGAFYALDYIGAPYIFSKRKISNTQGALAVNCISEIPGAHVVLGQGDLYIHNGSEPKSVIDKRMRRWMVQNIDTTNYKRCWVAANPVTKEVWAGLCLPGGTEPTVALVWNWQDDTTQVRDLPNVNHGATGLVDYSASDSWASDSDAWSLDTSAWNSSQYATTAGRLILASVSNTKLYLTEINNTFDGSTMTAYCERQGLSISDPSAVKLVKGVRPIIEAPYGTVLTVSWGCSMDQATDAAYTVTRTFTVGSDQKVDGFATGRFISLKITSQTSQQWRCKRIDVEVEPSGVY